MQGSQFIIALRSQTLKDLNVKQFMDFWAAMDHMIGKLTSLLNTVWQRHWWDIYKRDKNEILEVHVKWQTQLLEDNLSPPS